MGDVVYLAKRPSDGNIDTEFAEVAACKRCRNKTWLIYYEPQDDGYPRLRCACCGQTAGTFGWVGDKS